MSADAEIIVAVALGIGLAGSAGFRVFVPMLIVSIAAHMGVLPVREGFEWMADWPAMICFGTATLVEIGAYYIPAIDNLLDTVATPMAVGAGTLLMTSILPIENGMFKWLTGFIVGGGMAAVVQSGTVLTRLASTTTTGGAANPVLTTGENAAAIGSSLLSLMLPMIAAVAFICLGIVLVFVFRKRIFRIKGGHNA